MNFQDKSAECRYCTPGFPKARYCSEDCELKYLKVLRHAKKSEQKTKRVEQWHIDAWLMDRKTNACDETVFTLPFRLPGLLRQAGATWLEIQDAMNHKYHRKWGTDYLMDLGDAA